jgi:formate hydrogenlyase transcriptional activator
MHAQRRFHTIESQTLTFYVRATFSAFAEISACEHQLRADLSRCRTVEVGAAADQQMMSSSGACSGHRYKEFKQMIGQIEVLRRTIGASGREVMISPQSPRVPDVTARAKPAEGSEERAGASRRNEFVDGSGQYQTREDLEAALKEAKQSEARLRKIIDTIPTLAWCDFPDGSNEFLNRRLHDYTGLSPQAVHSGGWGLAIHPEDLPRLTTEWGTLRDRESSECEVRLRRSDGVFRWFLFRVEALGDETREVVRWYGTATDIEDRKRAEDLAAGEKRLLELVTSGHSMAEILEALCQFVESTTSGCHCSVVLVDPSGTRLEHGAAPSLPASFVASIIGRPVNADSGPCAMAAYLNEQVIAADLSTETRWAAYEWCPMALAHGVRACWSTPISSTAGKVLGAFAIYYSEPRMPTPQDRALIDQFTHIASITVERERSQEALRKALDEIRESEATLRQTVDTIPTLAWCTLPDGLPVFLNQRWHEYTGLSSQESQGSGWQTTIHPEDLQQLMDTWRKILASGAPGELEARLKRHDGEFRWFLFRTAPFRDQFGTIVKWYGTNTDIDDLKRAQVKLCRDEEEFRRITDAIPQMIVVLHPDGRTLYANRVALDYTGLTLQDFRAEDFRARVFHPEDIQRLHQLRQDALSNDVPFENEQRALGKDGKYRWFLIRYNPLLDENGNVIRWYATGTDIEARKQEEDRIRNENVALREEIERSSMFEEIVGSSEALRQVLKQVSKVAPTDSTVLILGETGTGKELIARAIHNRSKRSSRAFIRVNCAAIPDSLIASELFGHEKGSFTGALQRRLGRFESADGGTIFLDEVGELPVETQVALLRVLQERQFERVGGNQTISIDVRVLAATNRDLSVAVAEGTFRRDLFYRLDVFPIRIPALRERVEDIQLLVEYLIDRFAHKAGKKIRNITKGTLALFQSYEWPGNIRELQNVIERAVILCDGETLSVDETWLTRADAKSSVANVQLIVGLAEREREMIETALQNCKGLISGPTGAAARLGIPRQTLVSKITKLGINRHLFRPA